MGTNYYTKLNNCDACKRYDEVHLGKSSFGWQFSFQYNGGKYYKNVNEMKKWLKDKVIFDEYNRKISNTDFWKMVKVKQSESRNHANEYPDEREMVIDGYSFSDREFS